MGDCWSHGKYDGWSCPTCDVEKALKEQTKAAERIHEEETRNQERHAQEILDAQRDAAEQAEEDAWETQMALEAAVEERRRIADRAAEEHRSNIANAWKLEAESKAEQAYDLYEARMFDQACALAREALGEKAGVRGDPGNLEANQIVAWSLTETHKPDDARKYYLNQIMLLSTDQYRTSADSFSSVLVALPEERDLLSAFSQTLHKNAIHWDLPADEVSLLADVYDSSSVEDGNRLAKTLVTKFSKNPAPAKIADDLVGLTTVLLEHKLIDEAKRLAHALVPRVGGESKYLVQNFERLLDSFVTRGLLVEAKELVDSLVARSDSLSQRDALLIHADQIELGLQTGDADTKHLASLLDRVPANTRKTLLNDFQNINRPDHRFSEKTINLIRSSIGARYKRWETEIAGEISQTASQRAKSTSAVPFGCLFGGLSYLGLGVALSFTLVQVARTRGIDDPTPVLATASLLCSILIAIWGGLLWKQVRKNAHIRNEIETLESSEKQEWSPICASTVCANGPSQSRILLQFFILLGIVLLFAGSAVAYVYSVGDSAGFIFPRDFPVCADSEDSTLLQDSVLNQTRIPLRADCWSGIISGPNARFSIGFETDAPVQFLLANGKRVEHKEHVNVPGGGYPFAPKSKLRLRGSGEAIMFFPDQNGNQRSATSP